MKSTVWSFKKTRRDSWDMLLTDLGEGGGHCDCFGRFWVERIGQSMDWAILFLEGLVSCVADISMSHYLHES